MVAEQEFFMPAKRTEKRPG